MTQLANSILDFEQWFSLSDFILPLLLVFIIVYAILQKTKILGESMKRLNVGVALIIALLFVIPHITGVYPANFDPVEVLKTAIPQVSVVIVAVIMLLILIGVFGQDKVFLGASLPGIVAIFSIGMIVIIFGGAAGWWDSSINSWITATFGPNTLSVAVMLLVFALVVGYITSDEKDKKKDRGLDVDFNKLFGGGGGHH